MKKHNPNYEYMFWTNKKVKELFEIYPQIARWKKLFYETVIVHIEKCDLLRLLIMYTIGGIYCDLDMTCHQSFDTILSNRCFAMVKDWHHMPTFTLGAFSTKDPAIFNGFMASAPNQAIFPQILDFILYCYRPTGLVMSSTGPFSIGKFFEIEGIYSETDYAELLIDRCYIIPEGFLLTKEERDQVDCTNVTPVTSVTWTQGGSWQFDQSPYFVSFAIKRCHLYLIFFFLIAGILLFILLRRKTHDLKKCIVSEKKCQTQVKNCKSV
jgi:mannosyltransferase OCH1-like enzyme